MNKKIVKMPHERINEVLDTLYGDKKQRTWEDYRDGKQFIAQNVSSSWEYDQCIQHLLKLLNL